MGMGIGAREMGWEHGNVGKGCRGIEEMRANFNKKKKRPSILLYTP